MRENNLKNGIQVVVDGTEGYKLAEIRKQCQNCHPT